MLSRRNAVFFKKKTVEASRFLFFINESSSFPFWVEKDGDDELGEKWELSAGTAY